MSVLDRVYRAHLKLVASIREEEKAVEAARDEGCTWDQIARMLGVTAWAANSKFKKKVQK